MSNIWNIFMAHTVHGRLNRRQYILGLLGNICFAFIFALTLGLIAEFIIETFHIREALWLAFEPVLVAFVLLGISCVSLFLTIGRLHDMDFSGDFVIGLFWISTVCGIASVWFEGFASVSAFLGFIGLIVTLYCLLVRGTKGENRFGNAPSEKWIKQANSLSENGDTDGATSRDSGVFASKSILMGKNAKGMLVMAAVAIGLAACGYPAFAGVVGAFNLVSIIARYYKSFMAIVIIGLGYESAMFFFGSNIIFAAPIVDKLGYAIVGVSLGWLVSGLLVPVAMGLYSLIFGNVNS